MVIGCFRNEAAFEHSSAAALLERPSLDSLPPVWRHFATDPVVFTMDFSGRRDDSRPASDEARS